MKIQNTVQQFKKIALTKNLPRLYRYPEQIRHHITNSNESSVFYEYDFGYIAKQYQRWKNLMPNVRPFYAIKANPDINILKFLGSFGSGFDCASWNEIKTVISAVENLNISSSINFGNTIKYANDLKKAANSSIKLTSVDSEEELEKLKKFWPNSQILIRIECNRYNYGPIRHNLKFGVKEKHFNRILLKASELDLNVIGVNFHSGSHNEEIIDVWSEFIEFSYCLLKRLPKYGYQPKILNIGGGFPASTSVSWTKEYAEREKKIDQLLSDVHNTICKCSTIMKNKSDAFKKTQIIGEPGSYMVQGSGILATKIIGKRKIEGSDEIANNILHSCRYYDWTISIAPNNEFQDKVYQLNQNHFMEDEMINNYFISDGIYGAFVNLHYIKLQLTLMFVLKENGAIRKDLADSTLKRFTSNFFGPTCCGSDVLFYNVKLIELFVDDWLVWSDMGNYTASTRSNFNGIPGPDCFYHITRQDLQIARKLCILNKIETSERENSNLIPTHLLLQKDLND